jgi:glycosyltransferase domain-containing protein
MQNHLLTIVLTLKNRSDFTYRWMNYMNDICCPYKILIADGGDDLEVENILKINTNYPNIIFEYFKFPYDNTLVQFYSKLEKIIDQVETKYFLLADNDDFFIFNHFNKFIEILENDNSYIGARGKLINLSIYDKDGIITNTPFGKSYIALSKDSKDINNTSPINRVEFLCNNFSKFDYYTNWYCIFRKNDYLNIFKKLNIIPIKEVIVNEILMNVLLAFNGKIYINNDPFIIRQLNSSMLGDKLMHGNSFLERCLVNGAFTDFTYSINNYTDADQDSKDKILASIATWLEYFIYNNYKQNSNNNPFFSFIKLYIKNNTYIYKVFYYLYLKYRNLKNKDNKIHIVNLPIIESYILIKNKTIN